MPEEFAPYDNGNFPAPAGTRGDSPVLPVARATRAPKRNAEPNQVAQASACVRGASRTTRATGDHPNAARTRGDSPVLPVARATRAPKRNAEPNQVANASACVRGASRAPWASRDHP